MILRLVPPLAQCEHTQQKRRHLWRCVLQPHGVERRHVLRAVR